jgi:hypothetical protein
MLGISSLVAFACLLAPLTPLPAATGIHSMMVTGHVQRPVAMGRMACIIKASSLDTFELPVIRILFKVLFESSISVLARRR